jgi:hypothetical protein
MTPKEKADELVRKYYSFGINNVPFSSFSWFECRACALIAVDEILYITEHESPSTYVYYVKVKQEIEKL